MAIAYDGHSHSDQPSLVKLESRPNGSLYSRQKRSIADACEWLRLNQNKDRKALIFCLTSPGYTSLANQPKFISAFFDNMRKNYGMGDYVWVREMTKKGYPHFHVVAHWHPAKWFLVDKQDAPGLPVYKMITELSKYWSSLFNSDSVNSIRLGSYHQNKRVSFYINNEKQAWYLAKYIGKDIGHSFPLINSKNLASYAMAKAGLKQYNSTDMMISQGLVNTKRQMRSFGMSEQVALLSEPDLFESFYVSEVDGADWHPGKPLQERFKRVWKASEKELTQYKSVNKIVEPDEFIKAYSWRWTGHGQTFIGMDKKRSKSGRKADRLK